MNKLLAIIMTLAFAALAPLAEAQASCPPEVARAKELLAQRSGTAKGQDVQAPRSLAGARQKPTEAPRAQDVQAPRGQDVQAPRGQDTQAPRGQDVQAPRSLAGAKQPAGRNVTKASTLVKEAEAACKAGDMATAKSKAEAAIAALK
ncbi:MAG TPA: hypothetical protein VNO23_11685 [Candidatus Binatia bacterium]|nr:hypothetical protein [Candidatus Binatia bacterium]